ncbi:group 1 glycosyl transferase [Nostoc sp. NIES-4103]|nr:group 1 glycosyl transferase [Nostoc sp. NIES-4103]
MFLNNLSKVFVQHTWNHRISLKISNTQTMNFTIEKHIALISVDGDPAMEMIQEEAGGQNVYVRHVGEALAQQGWQVDMFTRKVSAEQATIIQHSQSCRTIRLKAGSLEFVPRDNLFNYLPEFVENFLNFERQESILYNLIHTNYWLSGWVGMQLKKIQGSKQVHTYHSLGAVEYNTIKNIPVIASQRLVVEKEVLETAETIVATSPQEKQHMRSLISTKGNIQIISTSSWDNVANQLSELYTQALREKSSVNEYYEQILEQKPYVKYLDRNEPCTQENQKQIVFVCYNTKDMGIVNDIVSALQKQKNQVIWQDQNSLRGGDQYFYKIQDAINKTKVALICIGKHGLGDGQIVEIPALHDRHRKDKIRLIPVLLDIDEIPEEQIFIRQLHYLKIKNSKVDDEFLNKLVNAISNPN